MKKPKTIFSIALFGIVAVIMVVSTSWAEDLRFGTMVEPTSIDPHFYNFQPNLAFCKHVFDRLVHLDHKQRPKPGLAVSWKPLDDKTWEFKLRKGVKFHDGSPFTADDVLFTMKRAPDVPNSPGSLRNYIVGKEFIKIDDYTVHVKTEKPTPLTPRDLAIVAIVSRKYGDGATTEDYNSGKAAIGTGPYKFVEWVRGDRIVVEANPNYWGDKPKWDRVITKPIKSDPSRVAALLNGDVDLIDIVPTVDIERLKKDPNIVISQSVSNRVMYLFCDVGRDLSPHVKNNDGTPMWPNPLRDWRVRKAISKAIDRNAIVERIMEGVAIPAGQLMSEGFFGYCPDLKPEPFDPEGAKNLLAKAGYGDGFRLTLHGPNDRYINDEKICEAVAQMLTRIGIKADVVTLPKSVYFGRATKREFSFMLLGWGADTGEASSPLKAVLHTYNKEAGFGTFNRARYTNSRVDEKVREAVISVEEAKRLKLLQEATLIAMNDIALIPLHFQVNTWATRKGLKFEGRTDSHTLAESVIKTD